LLALRELRVLPVLLAQPVQQVLPVLPVLPVLLGLPVPQVLLGRQQPHLTQAPGLNLGFQGQSCSSLEDLQLLHLQQHPVGQAWVGQQALG
jgi:hypothetical protein